MPNVPWEACACQVLHWLEEDGDEGKLTVQDILEPLRQYGTIVLVRYVQKGLVLESVEGLMLSYLLTWQSDSGLYLGDL